MPFMNQMLDRLAGKGWYCFLDCYSGYNQISIALEYQEKTTFNCPNATFAFKRMPFGLWNAQATFRRSMMSIFSDMVEDTIEVFMDDFSIVGDSFGCIWTWCIVINDYLVKNLVFMPIVRYMGVFLTLKERVNSMVCIYDEDYYAFTLNLLARYMAYERMQER